MQKLLNLLAHIPVFEQMSPDQRAEVARLGHNQTYRKSQYVTLHGQKWPYFLVVINGVIDVVKESAAGRRLALVTLRQGDIFWGIAFFGDDFIQPASFEVREDCQIVTWSPEILVPELQKSSQAMWTLCQLMVQRMQQASQIVEGLAFQKVATRLARLILDQAGDSQQPTLARDLTLDEMAAVVGSTREVVCRILYGFANDNLIEITRTEFILTDAQGLGTLASGE